MAEQSPIISIYSTFPIDLERAEGCELIAKDGRRYVDLYGGHCVCLLGHNPPALVDALKRQMERIIFYSTALGLEERDEAGRELVKTAPEGFDRVFFVNSGAEANENALKLACAKTARSTVVAIEGAFHGRTAAADSVTGGSSRKIHFPRAPFDVRWVKFGDADGIRAALSPKDVACVILEPVQSTAGCRAQPRAFVEALNEAAKEAGTLVIADEVQGGFGRCVEMWSHQAVGIRPDVISCAKGLGSGFPIGAMIVARHLGELPANHFGSTFGGGPLASAAAITVCRAVREPAFREHVRRVATVFDGYASIPGVEAMQGVGMLRGLKLRADNKKVRDRLLERGFIVGGSQDPTVARLLPPLTLPLEMAERFGQVLAEVLAEVGSKEAA